MEMVGAASGRLTILQPAGARVTAGAVVAQIAEAAAAPAPSRPAERTPPPAPGPPPAPTPPPVAAQPSMAAARPDAEARAEAPTAAPAAPVARPAPPPPPRGPAGDGGRDGEPARPVEAEIERVPMTEIRRTIATRLVEAQRQAAILTTFNDVDLGELQAVRARYRERFRAKHGVDLGLMSLFIRATVLALREFRVLNARIEGTDILHHRRVHMGVAVATPRGLVVPVIRNADTLTVAELERAVGDLAERARQAKIKPDDLTGGTFSITNGGVFGSLLSTPLLNPPQSGILGMHKIQERPVAVGGQVAVRPMMYVALSYDHRLVDGEQAVRFLVRVKEQLEDPARMLLDV
jgi:2-oxoglutarate dehydrogenase E2 component (dihydrolipoamide succinyltransferase)